jgi:bacillithiol biosynthesis deacetylase BshB1
VNDSAPGCDLLCLCPHTDDAEIAVGGTLRTFAARGRRVWVADLTRGELGSNGSPDERWAEAARASALLGLAGRIQCRLPDGFISVQDAAQVETVTAVIRALRPRWIVAAPMPNRHPDHRAIVELVVKATFLARLATYAPAVPEHRRWTEGAALPDPAERWVAEAVFAVCLPGEEPDLLVDVSAAWDAKLAALRCYDSQFSAETGRRATMINSPAFLEQVTRGAQSWGFRAGVPYAEALRTTASPVVTDLTAERWA